MTNITDKKKVQTICIYQTNKQTFKPQAKKWHPQMESNL